MCGIASFLSNERWKKSADISWVDEIGRQFAKAAAGRDPMAARLPLKGLAERFGDLMAFELHYRIVGESEVRKTVETMCADMRTLRDIAAEQVAKVRTDELEAVLETLNDYLWQVEVEVLDNAEKVLALMPESLAADSSIRCRHYLAWGTEQVLASIDKLEVRGRDSAGVSISFALPEGRGIESWSDEVKAEIVRREGIENAVSGHVLVRKLEDGRTICRFLYKVAQLVGQLGDNGSALRDEIVADELFWGLAQRLEGVNIIAHTRWASNGIISVPNCHPVDGLVEGDVGTGLEKTMFVLNGDVDNYRNLVETAVHSRGASIARAVTTDAKILPVLFHLDENGGVTSEDRFRNVLSRSEGSLAVIMQNLSDFDTQFLAQKGSGQSFYIGRTLDGWIVASEAYGMAARCRESFPMAVVHHGGASVILRASDSESAVPVARFFDETPDRELDSETIEIFSRDIYRGEFTHYIEKEVHEASNSVRNTLLGKYAKKNGGVEFIPQGFGNGEALIQRIHDKVHPIKRIVAVGQGTAAIAAMGVAHFMRLALLETGIIVESHKGSEFIGFMSNTSLEDTLVIAVSQSGTTTDTNRVVDLCRERGAWVHAIVNRRNSPLVSKSDSHIYTSNGRDVEMAVASTKAFYSQIAAGKLLSLWFASEFSSMREPAILADLEALEGMPDKIDSVLANKDVITDCADKYAPAYRYWAVVGNGGNRIAAEEIRIKLSELCYKSIPCDATEDKKHIDLSTEPLTLVMANDLPEGVVMDTVKETTIFKAHNGKPIVVCAADEDRFDGIAEAVIKVPCVGAGLDFIMATVAGHWWGIAAAKAIDNQAQPFREARILLGDVLEGRKEWDRDAFADLLDKAIDKSASGMTDSALPTHVAAKLSQYAVWLARQAKDVTAQDADLGTILNDLNKAIEEMTRPIDTIRHQAKTVTVGISRPQGDD